MRCLEGGWTRSSDGTAQLDIDMSRGIFLIHSGGSLTELREQRYESEALLQQLLAQYPSVLAGDDAEAKPRRWLLIDREAAIPDEPDGAARWAVDHVFLDQDGIPTFVEVKRSTDTRIRREVVGQMLDYAANAIANWPTGRMQAVFEARCERDQRSPANEMQAAFGGQVEPATLWDHAKTNLLAKRLRLVFVSDEIPIELRRVVEFLNEQMESVEVIAIEVRQYVGGDLRTLVPTVVGQTAEAQQRKSGGSAGAQWNEARFMEALTERLGEQDSARAAAVAQRMLEWSEARATRIYWGKGGRDGGFVPVVRRNGIDYQLFVVYTYGSIEVYFQYYVAKPPFDNEERRRDLQQRLNKVPGVSIPNDALMRRPTIRLKEIAEKKSVDQLLGVFDWFIEQLPP